MKAVAKKVLATFLSLCLVVCSVLLCVHISNESKLNKTWQDALETLTEDLGTYDEKTIVLNNTSRSTAENLADKLDAKLRITSNGSYATLTLQNGMTVRDVYEDRENRALLESFSLDYYSKTSDIEEQETVRQTTAPKYTVSDSLYSYQSYLDYLHIENAWENYRGSGVTVAVIDTGIDIDHPEFSGKISEYSYNATEDKIVKDYTLEDGTYDWSLIEDEQGHGTSVAGVIAASMDGNGIVGIAPEVTLLIIKAECNEKGNFLRTSDLVFGLYYAIERDADVVNMSFGSSSNVFSAPARLADDSDVTLIAAAGNESTSVFTYPAADENVIGVGALEDGGWNLAAYSNFGDNTDIVAPGTVYTTAIGGGYRTISGTSFASPITAAAVALLKSQDRYIENDSVKELLYASSYDLGGLGKDFYYGYGALDISALILEERGTVTFDMLTDELEDITQIFIRNHTLQNVPEPDRNYAVFDGWYYDIHCTEELNLYSDVWTSDLTLYANWVNEDDGVPYTYVILDDGTVEIRSYTGHRRYITVPDKIEDRVVSSIGDFAFSGETRLREVNLPRGLKKIGLNAFANCTNLLSMSIPDGVEEIGAYTFSNDSRLHTIMFGENSELKIIGNEAFENCGLLHFELPISLENVNGSAFAGCTRLTNYSVRKGNKSFIAQSGVLYSATKSTIIAFPAGKNVSAYTLPAETLTVGTCAFAYAKIETIELNNAQTIGSSAFLGAKLTALTIPDSVISLGRAAFAYDFNLRSLKIGKGLTTIPAGAFKMDNLLVEVKIPKNVQYIESGAFKNCISLTSVTFEKNSNLAYIGISAFSGNNIKQIEIPRNVVNIDKRAFEENFGLSDVSFEFGSVLRTMGEKSFAYTYSLTNITLPENLVVIGDFAFIDSGLSSVTIPKTVAELGKGAFASCHSLENIFIESGNENYVDTNGVVYSKDKTIVVEYPAGKNSTEYEVIDGVKKIGNCAFYGAWNLNTVYLPDGVESVGEYAFYDCENVISYSLPETLIAIEKYAFSENYSLNYIPIPDNVIQISNYAFSYDYNLNTIYLSDSSKLPRISFAAFAYTGITSIRIPANVSTIAQYAFTGSNNLQTVTFAANSKLDIIPAYMFTGANNITDITFESGSSLTSIAAHGFEGMRRLISVDFGDAKLKNIDNYAFRYCESLQTVNIPDGIEIIGRFAFYGCKSLTRLDLPETIDYIGRFAFYFAENLNVYFKADILPANLQENWDYGISGYYVGVTDILESGDWKYAILSTGGISIIKYTGSETTLDLTNLDLGGEIKQIGGYAFAYSKITSIIFPEMLEIIQRYAFANSKLESVIIPSNVSFIGQYAFFNTPVKTIIFGKNSSLRKIEQYTFAYTTKLSEIVIPNGVEEIQSYAFYQSGIEIITFEHGVKLTKIAAHAFASSGLISVVIPDSVNYIDDNAFRDCLSLQTITFGSAENLQVHANAFYNTAISSLYIPANLEYVGEYAFIGLENLKEYIVDDENPYYKSNDGVLYEKDGKKLIAFPAGKIGAFEVPNSVETIGFGAFENTKIESVSFADDINLLTLGYRAFYNAKNLISVSVPDSVISIDYYAFAECRNLESVTFAEDNLLTGIYEGAFLNCISLKNIIIPDSIIEISDYAFYGCSSLTRLPFSETATVKGIYDYAFAYTGIRELVIPDSVTDIGAYAFRGARVKSVVIPDAQKDVLVIGIGALQDCDKLEELDIPFSGASLSDGETRVWFGYIFGAGAVEANSVYMPKALKTVAITQVKENSWERIFGNCYNNNLESIESVVLPVGVIDVGNWAFNGCSSLTSITIPESVTSIGEQAFRDCSSLTSVTLPESLKSIENFAFYGCSDLKSITIAEGVTSIGNSAFSDCSSLTNITIPEGLTSIENLTFDGCSSLTSITIPESVTNIADAAFYGCKFSSINYKSDLEKWLTIDHISTDLIIAEGGELFIGGVKIENEINISENVTCISSGAFYNCSGLTGITLPEGLTSIENYAFYGCSSLTSITIPERITRVGDYVFYGCIGLTGITLPEGLTSIENFAFSGCSGLTSITIPESVTNIGNYAFFGCYSLYQIKNNSALQFTLGSEEYGSIARYAKVIIDKDGNKAYLDEYDGFAYIDTIDGFRFIQGKTNAALKLIAYLGRDEVVTLPVDFNGENYDIYQLKGVKNVILPNGMSEISDYAFQNCNSLISITIPESVTSIGEQAFYGCSGLTEITLPKGLTSIGNFAFYGCGDLISITIPESVTGIGEQAFRDCSSLTSIEIPESVKSIGGQAFYNCSNLTSITLPDNIMCIGAETFRETVYANNPNSWKNGCLYIGKHLVDVVKDVEYIVILPNTICMAYGVFDSCNKLKSVTIGGKHEYAFIGATNIETLILTDLPDNCCLYSYFAYNNIPITLKNIVLQKNCNITGVEMFYQITGVNIYVENQKIATQWDHDYPGWNNGNKVYYGGEWINAEFKDENGKILSSDYYTVNQVVRQPFVADIPNGKTKFVFVGWDIDGDGIADGVPATSTHNISATAIMKEVDNECVINFYDYFGNLYDTKTYVYGETIVLPENPVKKGYIFNGWRGYEVGSIATESIDYYSVWSHDDEGHNYVVKTVAPTCETDGYDLHICSICDDEYRDNYVVASGHQFGDWIIDAEATCEGNGLRHHICLVCKASVSEEIFAHGHEYIVDSKIDASCSHQGKKVYACLYCGNTVEETTPVLAHEYEKKYASKSWIEWLIDKLLNVFFGYEDNNAFYYRCINCGHIQTMAEAGNSTMAAGTCEHELGDWTLALASTCTEQGVYAKYCTKCGEMIEAKSIEALGHNYSEISIVESTCTERGYTLHTCVNCADSYATDFTEKKEHKVSEWIIDSEAGCITAGSRHRECTECGKLLETEIIPAKGHSYGEIQTVAATCENAGYTYHICAICGSTEKVSEIPATGHTEVIDAAKESTCTETGLTEGKHCSVCNKILVKQEVVEKKEHKESAWIIDSEAGCITAGSRHRECTECKTLLETEIIPAKGHSYGEIQTVAATCENAGYTYHVCATCGYLEKVSEIPATGHTEVIDVAKESTCTETGLTEGKHCSVCGKVLIAQEVTGKKEHKVSEWIIDSEAGCITAGSRHRECTECGKLLETEIIPAKGHSYGEIQIVAATCENAGYTYHVCAICGYTEKVSEIPATGHTTSDWITDYDSTCAQAGARHKECTECHTILEFETIEPIEHEYGEWTIDKEPTNSIEGHEYRECARCGHLEKRSLPKIEQEDKSGCESGCSGSVEERNWSLLIVVMFFAGTFVFLKRKQ